MACGKMLHQRTALDHPTTDGRMRKLRREECDPRHSGRLEGWRSHSRGRSGSGGTFGTVLEVRSHREDEGVEVNILRHEEGVAALEIDDHERANENQRKAARA